jgi:hypothetical protein
LNNLNIGKDALRLVNLINKKSKYKDLYKVTESLSKSGVKSSDLIGFINRISASIKLRSYSSYQDDVVTPLYEYLSDSSLETMHKLPLTSPDTKKMNSRVVFDLAIIYLRVLMMYNSSRTLVALHQRRTG